MKEDISDRIKEDMEFDKLKQFLPKYIVKWYCTPSGSRTKWIDVLEKKGWLNIVVVAYIDITSKEIVVHDKSAYDIMKEFGKKNKYKKLTKDWE